MEDSEMASAVPESVIESAKETLANLNQVESELPPFLSLCDSQTLSEMPPIERAKSLFLLAKATTTIFALKLRTSGIHPDDHPVLTELSINLRVYIGSEDEAMISDLQERLKVFEEKLQRYVDLSKAPLKPSTTLNQKAAARFIEHSLPDLTPEQKRSLRDISKGEGPRMNYTENSLLKKRKYQSEKQSVQAAAKEFLEKAAREIVCENPGGLKGPIIDISDDEEEAMV